jgi:hypothetical protein
MIVRLIIFLIRKRLGVKKYQWFKFSNQKKEAVYWFEGKKLMKIENGVFMPSNVCLNWLVDDECKVVPVK